MSINNFYSNDFLTTFIFGAGGVFLFYFVPFGLFAYFYLQFRGNNEEVTIEGLNLRYMFYSIVSIIVGAVIFSLLSVMSFSTTSNAIKGFYNFLQYDWSDINSVLNSIDNNTNLLSTQKDSIKFLALLLMVFKMTFNILAIVPVMLLIYLMFTGTIKCKKQYENGGNDINSCIIKKFFYIMLFIIMLYVIFIFADTVSLYLIKHFLNASIDKSELHGIFNSAIDMIKKVKADAIEYIK